MAEVVVLSILARPIVNTVVDLITSLSKSQISLLKGLKNDLEKLASNLTAIQATLQDAEDKQQGSERLRDWLGKIEEAAYDAEDMLETFETEAFAWQKKGQGSRILINGVSESAFKLGAANKIKKLLERFDEIGKEKRNFDLSSKPVLHMESSDDRRTTNYVNETDVVGREDDKKNIIDMLLSEQESRKEGHISAPVSIIGMGGLGKTTLAQLVYNDHKLVYKDNHTMSKFSIFMWACVTEYFNYANILKEMIESHSKMKLSDIDTSSPGLLEDRLLDIIKDKNILLVLDDVWTENYEDWEKLQRLLIRAGKDSKVLITSRTTSVFSLNNTRFLYKLECLPEDECWSLFENIAFTGNVRSDLAAIGKDIVRKCEGLPLAVRAMGGLLRGIDDINKWKRIQDNDIWKVEMPTTNLHKPRILPALRLSYKHLPSHIKTCFSYCYIFPKGYLFDKTELIKLWNGSSVISSTTSGRIGNVPDPTTDVRGSDYFDVLLRMSFFQLSKAHSNRYQMHDLIHDLAQSVSIPHSYQIHHNKPCEVSHRSRHVSLLCEKAEQPILNVIEHSAKLRTLLAPTGHLKDFGQSLDKLFHATKFIRALDLSSSTMLELPKSVGELKLLRYLDLSKTELKCLPDTICSLYHLQTLKLLGCLWLFELPKRLGDLVNLQHLELDDMFWVKCCMPPPKIGNLTNLLDLHSFPVSTKDGSGIGELGNMKNLTGKLHISKLENAVSAKDAEFKNKESLDEVAFEWSHTNGGSPQDGEAHEKVLEDLEPHSNIKKLSISNYHGALFPLWVRSGRLTNLVNISFRDCTNCEVLSLSQLPHLRELYIKGMLQLEEWRKEDYECHSLVRLKITNCPNLRELPPHFINLQVLKIKGCNSLKSLPLTPSLIFLILLDNLALEHWNEVVLVSDQEQFLASFINVIELTIKNCPKMPGLPEVFAPQKLVISGCPLLTTLPNPEFSRRFQHLAIDGCGDGTLLNSIPNTDSLYSLVISNISNLICLPKLPSLPGLKTLYIHHCQHLQSLSQGEASQLLGLKSLTLLSIRDCPKLVALPQSGLPSALEYLSIELCNALEVLGPNHALQNLTSLKDLYIENCPSLRSLPDDGLPTSLRHLRIQGCPLLEQECRKDSPQWPKIMHIPDLDCDFLDQVSSPEQNKNSKKKSQTISIYNRLFRRKGKQKQGESSS